MALVKCPECSKEISSEVKSCPNCGKQLRMGMMKKALIAFGSLIVLVMIVNGMGGSKTSGGSEAPTSGAEAPAEPAMSVSAKQLSSAYEANEVSADNSYKGKRLLVDGVVQSIGKDIMNNVYVVLRGRNDFQGVHATMMESETGTAAKLSKGDRLTVLCKGNGKMLTDPMLDDCRVQ